MLSRMLKKWYMIYSLCTLYSIIDVIKDVEKWYMIYSLCLYSISMDWISRIMKKWYMIYQFFMILDNINNRCYQGSWRSGIWYTSSSRSLITSIIDVIKDLEEVVYHIPVYVYPSIIDVIKDLEEVVYDI